MKKQFICLMILLAALGFQAKASTVPFCNSTMGCVEHYLNKQLGWIKNIFVKKENKEVEFLVEGSVSFVRSYEILIRGEIIEGNTSLDRDIDRFVAKVPRDLSQVQNCEDSEVLLSKGSNSNLIVKDFLCRDDQ